MEMAASRRWRAAAPSHPASRRSTRTASDCIRRSTRVAGRSSAQTRSGSAFSGKKSASGRVRARTYSARRRAPGNEDLPHAAFEAHAHRVASPVPVVEVADDADAPRVRGPDGEGHAGDAVDRARVRAERLPERRCVPSAIRCSVEVAEQADRSGTDRRVPRGRRSPAAIENVVEGLASSAQSAVRRAVVVDTRSVRRADATSAARVARTRVRHAAAKRARPACRFDCMPRQANGSVQCWASNVPGYIGGPASRNPLRARRALDQLGDEPGPAGLMAGAQAGSVVAVEVLVEQDADRAKADRSETSGSAEDRAAPVCVARERFRSSRCESSAATSQSVTYSPGAGRQLDLEVVAVVVMEVLQRFDHEVVEREPDRPAPVRVSAEQSRCAIRPARSRRDTLRPRV